jgi:hypothetical protein
MIFIILKRRTNVGRFKMFWYYMLEYAAVQRRRVFQFLEKQSFWKVSGNSTTKYSI